ncbi:hypothetical protein [Streptomyces sp. NPDC096132]|uniref:DesA/ISL3 alpha bundle tail domain-containing protein n=1 Tax=Streptomyces sp. NPDC096132 TaxID=3366075 RepID=UPI0038060EA3
MGEPEPEDGVRGLTDRAGPAERDLGRLAREHPEVRIGLHHRWMEGCIDAAALTREIQQLGYRGHINTVRRRLRPYRSGTIPTAAPLPHSTVRGVTDWIMRRPERLTATERECLDELCERSPALATTTQYARRLAAMVRERRGEHLALDVWLADVPFDGQRELRTLAAAYGATAQPYSPP